MSKRVVIVGGGLAGLAAAAGLASAGAGAGAGAELMLLESRPRLGGRAGSFLDRERGEWIDTCQHVAMGCCTNLLHFARLVGINDLFEVQRELLFVGPGGQRCRFAAAALPAPLHLLGAFLRLRFLTLGERLRICRDVAKLAHHRWAVDHGLSFEDWLNRHARTSDLRERFWDVLLVSALSETADRIAVPHARKVFVDGFLSHRNGWQVQIPTVPLDELYTRRVTDWLGQRGVNVRRSAGVARLDAGAGRIAAVQLRSGETIVADEFVLAVPWHRVVDLLPPGVKEQPWASGLQHLQSAPITSVHLWFDRPVIDVPHAVLIGRLSQWVFRRSGPAQLADHSPRQSQAGDSLQVVISASRNIAGRSQVSVIEEVVGELAAVWPRVRESSLTGSRVVTEHRAVFSPLPGARAWRPDQQSPMANLQLAGDWTDTGWPATMEGAVKSGYLAAENILRYWGHSPALVQPGLPRAWLARRLLALE